MAPLSFKGYMSKVIDKCKNEIEILLNKNNYYLFDIEYKKNVNKDFELVITIDSDNGIDLNDCIKVNDLLNPLLDDLDPTNGEPYLLTVLSPGLDRPLKYERDYKNNLNKKIDISFYQKFEDIKDKKIKATLIDYKDDYIVVIYKNKKYKIDKNKLALIKQAVEI